MSSTEDTEGESWVQWFCGQKGNEFFCEVRGGKCCLSRVVRILFLAFPTHQVERSYIQDGFNLYGLRTYVSSFQFCLDMILDRVGACPDFRRKYRPNLLADSPPLRGTDPDDFGPDEVTRSAGLLYGENRSTANHGTDNMPELRRAFRISLKD